MLYEYGEFEKPVVDWQQGANAAAQRYGSFEFRVSVLALSFGLLFSLRQW